MWWDDDTIQATVTRQFACSHLIPEDVERLDRPTGFGDGLTDSTYWEWIDERAKRLFLILIDLGLPDQIFYVIDDSWDDDDLPIALDQVERLELSRHKDVKLERKFYYRQFHYLLKPIRQGYHVFYDDMDVVPLDTVEGKQGLAQNRYGNKVVLPNQPDVVLCRRCIPLGSDPGRLSHDDFLYQVNNLRRVQNEHLKSYWASYVHQNHGYILFTQASNFSLKSLLATTPTAIKNLNKQARSHLVLNWIHCLVDTLCFIHSRGLSHGNIRPSTILYTSANHIFYSDLGHLGVELSPSRADKAPFDKERYDYMAPEQRLRSNATASSPTTHRKSSLPSPSSPRASMPPYPDDQAADIFSLGCVILELLTFLMKRQSRAFASHRAAKHKTPGRGGAVPDSSFHGNLGQVGSWAAQLAKEAAAASSSLKRKVLLGNDGGDGGGDVVGPILRVAESMLAPRPSARPAAREAQERIYEILTGAAGCGGGVFEPHCVHWYGGGNSGGWDFGFGSDGLGGGPGRVARNDDNGHDDDGCSETTSTQSLEYRRASSRGSSSGGGSASAGSVGRDCGAGPGRAVAGARGGSRTAHRGGGFRSIRNLRIGSGKWQQFPGPVSV